MGLFKRKVVHVPGFRFNVGDEVWILRRRQAESRIIIGRAWAEGHTSDWWEKHKGETYFFGGFYLRGDEVFATKEELLASL